MNLVSKEIHHLSSLLGDPCEDFKHVLVGARLDSIQSEQAVLSYTPPVNLCWIVTLIRVETIPPVNDPDLTIMDWRNSDIDASGEATAFFRVQGVDKTAEDEVAFAVVNQPCYLIFAGGSLVKLFINRNGGIPVTEAMNIVVNSYLVPNTCCSKVKGDTSYEGTTPPAAPAFAYVNDGDPDLNVYDITTPTAVVARGVYNGSGAPWTSPHIRDGFLYYGDSSISALHVIDVSDPDAPNEVATVSQPFGNSSHLALDDEPDGCVYLAIAGDQRIDIWNTASPASPSAPAFVTSQPTTSGDARALAQQGGNLFSLEYLAGPLTLRIYSNPCSSFTLKGEVALPAGYGNEAGLAVPGDGFAYVGGVTAGGAVLRIIDVSDINNPTLKGELIIANGIIFALLNVVVDVDRGVAYLCYGDSSVTGQPRWLAVNVSNPNSPSLLASVAVASPGQTFFGLSKIPNSDELWVLRFVGAPPGLGCRLEAYDVSTPSAPALIAGSSTNIDSSAFAVLVN